MLDDIVLYKDDTRKEILTTFHTLRQQMDKPEDQSNYALSDFIAPVGSGRHDYLGAFALTTGLGVEDLARAYEKDLDDYNAIMTKALADRFAEAAAEWLHLQARIAWGFGETEALSKEDLIKEQYRGIRPAPGYPAQPDHTEKRLLFDLLQAEKNAQVILTENFAMHPASSVSGLYFAHPEAKYFGVGMINRDQVEEYAQRKGFDLALMEKWLAPNLSYDPDKVAALRRATCAVYELRLRHAARLRLISLMGPIKSFNFSAYRSSLVRHGVHKYASDSTQAGTRFPRAAPHQGPAPIRRAR